MSRNRTSGQNYLLPALALLFALALTSADSVVQGSAIDPDHTYFPQVLQNEVCNQGLECARQASPQPGYIGFWSGLAGPIPSILTPSEIRVAQIALCPVTDGTARLHWQFSPPAPQNRNTRITS